MNKTFIDPYYSSGQYLNESGENKDAKYKIYWTRKFLQRHLQKFTSIHKIADIGCGSGQTTVLLNQMFSSFDFRELIITGYDVHPNVEKIEGNENVQFIKGDFLEITSDICDFIFLYDVVEHLVMPQRFLNCLAEKTKWIVLHLPLDNSLFVWLRNLPRQKILSPGHILYLDESSALNLLTLSGFKLIDYEFTPAFSAPSGRDTRLQNLIYPLRSLLYRISPYLLEKTLGGTSILVLARSPMHD
jgi:SAM-dependent methyltransferase